MSSSSATSPAELSLRPTLWRTRGNGRRTRPTTTSCARRTLKQPAWLALGRLLPVGPTFAVVPLVKMHRTGQPLRLGPLIDNAPRWPTTSVVPLIENAPRLANPFGCPDQSKPTPLRLCLWSRCIALANPFSVVPSIKSAQRWPTPLRLCPRSKVHRVRPTQRPYSHLANHLGCACQPFRLCCQLLQLCLPAITAVPPIFLGPLRSAWPIGLARLRIHLPTIPVVLANHFGCACQLL
jgi:hypothetical protein